MPATPPEVKAGSKVDMDELRKAVRKVLDFKPPARQSPSPKVAEHRRTKYKTENQKASTDS